MVTSPTDQSMKQADMEEEAEEEEGKVILPNELVERILSMVPFPTVFKFRVLAKPWRARLSSISPQDDDGTRHLALLFRTQISHQSSKWKRTFCPFSISENREHFVAFDRSSNRWLRILLPPYLQSKIPVQSVFHKVHGNRVRSPHAHDLRMEGALLLMPISRDALFITNILTRSWRQLPPCPHGTDLGRILLSQTYSESYKVIVMPHERDNHTFLQIYDSNSCAWSTLKLTPSLFNRPSNNSNLEPVAYVNGVLYLVTIPITLFRQLVHLRRVSLKVLSIKIKEEAQLQVEVSAQDFNIVGELVMPGKALARVNPVICETNLLIIFLYLASSQGEEIQAVHIDLETGNLLRVVLCPIPCPPILEPLIHGVNSITDDGDIIARVNLSRGQVLTYNVKEDKWVWLHYSGLIDELPRSKSKYFEESIRSSFRPGLNPFAEV
ncbi:unnamed protein product [Calypogeia fissa]